MKKKKVINEGVITLSPDKECGVEYTIVVILIKFLKAMNTDSLTHHRHQ